MTISRIISTKSMTLLQVLKEMHIPKGMHIFGRLPSGEKLADFVHAIVRFDTGRIAEMAHSKAYRTDRADWMKSRSVSRRMTNAIEFVTRWFERLISESRTGRPLPYSGRPCDVLPLRWKKT